MCAGVAFCSLACLYLCETQRKNYFVTCSSASEIPKASQQDNEQSAVENRDPNKHQAASQSIILTQCYNCHCQNRSPVSFLPPVLPVQQLSPTAAAEEEATAAEEESTGGATAP